MTGIFVQFGRRPDSPGWVEDGSGCWVWVGGRMNGGYGACYRNRKMQNAHRAVYEHFRGRIADGLHLDHLCRNRICVNPDHMEPVTCRENIRRGVGPSGINSRKTHCSKGHPLTGRNLRLVYKGKRKCYICQREDWRMYKERRRLRRAVGAVHDCKSHCPNGHLLTSDNWVEKFRCCRQCRNAAALAWYHRKPKLS